MITSRSLPEVSGRGWLVRFRISWAIPAGVRARSTRLPRMLDFQFQVGGFDLPPLVIERDQFRCREPVVVDESSDQPVAAGEFRAVYAGHDDLGVDHPHVDCADTREICSVVESLDRRQHAVGLAADQ